MIITKENSHYVRKGEIIVSSKDYLYTDSLGTSVAIFLMTKDYSILANVETVAKREFRNERSAKIEDMEELILKDSELKRKTMYIALVRGEAEPDQFEARRNLVSFELDEMLIRINQQGYDLQRLEDLTSDDIILDNINHKIITKYEDYVIEELETKNKKLRKKY